MISAGRHVSWLLDPVPSNISYEVAGACRRSLHPRAPRAAPPSRASPPPRHGLLLESSRQTQGRKELFRVSFKIRTFVSIFRLTRISEILMRVILQNTNPILREFKGRLSHCGSILLHICGRVGQKAEQSISCRWYYLKPR